MSDYKECLNSTKFSGVHKKVVFQKGGFWRMFPGNEIKPERGYVRMFRNENRNEGTFAKTSLLRNPLLSPGENSEGGNPETPCPSLPWSFCFLGVFLADFLVFLSAFCLFYKDFKGSESRDSEGSESEGRENPTLELSPRRRFHSQGFRSQGFPRQAFRRQGFRT